MTPEQRVSESSDGGGRFPMPRPERFRVARSDGAIYGSPRACRTRRRCDGHLASPHWIEVGEPVYWSALPPDSDVGNKRWWHHAYCQDCAPNGVDDAEA